MLCAGLPSESWASALPMPRMGKLSYPPTGQITVSTLCQCPAPSFPSRGKENKDVLRTGRDCPVSSSTGWGSSQGSREDKAVPK